MSGGERLEAWLATTQPGDQVVFDADHTIWDGDVTESLLAHLAERGRIGLDAVPPPIPVQRGETVMAYYERVVRHDVAIGYAWVSQVFAGCRVGMLVDEVRALATTPRRAAFPSPRERPGMYAFAARLRDRGVAVWIVSASPEVLVRARAFGPTPFPVDEAHIVGVDNLLVDPDGDVTSFGQIRDAGRVPSLDALRDHVMTTHLRTPIPWYEGKVAAILRYLPHLPRLVAGDSANDLPMLRTATDLGLWFGDPARAEGPWLAAPVELRRSAG